MTEFTVEHGGRKRTIVIPFSEGMDQGHHEAIIDWQKEKTLDDLKKLPPRVEPRFSKEEVAGALKEYDEWKRNVRDYYK